MEPFTREHLLAAAAALMLIFGTWLIASNWRDSQTQLANMLDSSTPIPLPTHTPTATPTPPPTPTATATLVPTPEPSPTPESAEVSINIDAAQTFGEISQLIYGVSGASPEIMDGLRATGNSWGGNNSSRYNWREGNLWNAGHDYEFRNGTYGEEGMVADRFLQEAAERDAFARISLPTLGWVAKDNWSCSFVDDNGDCYHPQEIDCRTPGVTANPENTSVRSTPEDIRAWLQHMVLNELEPRILAMDNEPELWGFSHYDVHPNCSTYQEIVDQYIAYAKVAREEMPDAMLAGPVTCCWHFYWQSAAGLEDKAQHEYQDFLPWFLEQLRAYDNQNGRILDVLDVHYYPAELYNLPEETDETRAHRLRATRSLWDPAYVDESWIDEPVYLIPRMYELIDAHYPNTRFGISEWNFGADDTMNGAIALADALGIFGREGLYYANYWRHPEPDTPGWYAFRMFTNYDSVGGRFGSIGVEADSGHDMIGIHSSLDRETDFLHAMLLNRDPDNEITVELNLSNFSARQFASLYQYHKYTPDGIDSRVIEVDAQRIMLTLPPYSITQLVLQPDQIIDSE